MLQFSLRWLHRYASIGVVLAMVAGVLSAQEREDSNAQSRFSTASLCGNYAAIATYGANVARALGYERMDGQGAISGSAIVNQPGPNNTRTLTSIGISGTYTIDGEGIGTMRLTIALPGGGTANVIEDFVVTRSKSVDGIAIATEIEDAQEVPSAVIDDASLVIHSYSLRGSPRLCSTGH